ncbi:hypothetical protein BH11CYA1_BH11CYA1_47220 [soil metagenome]
MRKKATILLFCLYAAFLCPGQVLAENKTLYAICNDAACRAKLNGDMPKAERLYKEVLEMSESGDDPVAASNLEQSRYNLALLYDKQQKHNLSVLLYQKLLAGQCRFYKPDLLKTRIAECYLRSGKDAYAYKLLASVKPGQNRKGESQIHDYVLGAIAALKTGHKDECAGKLSSAMAAAITSGQALEAGRKQRPNAADFTAVAKWLGDNCCYEDAKFLSQILQSDLVKVRGWSNTETIDSTINLAILYRNSLASERGLALVDKAIQSQTGASADANKLKLLEAKTDFNLSEPQKLLVEKQALELSLTTGAAFSIVQQHLAYVTGLLAKAHKNQEAKALTFRMLEYCEKTYGKNSNETSYMLMRAGCELAAEHDFKAALAYNSRALAILEGFHKPVSVSTVADLLVNQATCEEGLKHIDQADETYKRMVAVFDNNHNETTLLMYLNAYEGFLRRVGRTSAANNINARIQAIFKKHNHGNDVVIMEDPGTTVKW